ncbi:MAG TPA: RNA polymerase sigma factor [Opitutaceae bacterium]|nr:RNA polymerase sigma factor [Opitutaceae bacterium]
MIALPPFPETPGASRPPIHPAGQTDVSEQGGVPDAELVRRFNGGDDHAFVEIIMRYRKKMLSLALSLIRNRADAEEIAQDTFVRAHRGLGRFRGDSSLSTWLHRIALNLSRNHYRYFFRRYRHATLSLDTAFNDDSQMTISDLIASDAPSPAHAATNQEFLAHVTVCMKKLSNDQREILILRNEFNQPYSDIAEKLGIDMGTVKSRIGRARKNLRQLLAESYAGAQSDSLPSYQWFESSRPAGYSVATGG